jgi:hypothetical protein
MSASHAVNARFLVCRARSGVAILIADHGGLTPKPNGRDIGVLQSGTTTVTR